MALPARANITAEEYDYPYSSAADSVTQLALYKLEIPGKVPKTEILIVYTNYWYRTT